MTMDMLRARLKKNMAKSPTKQAFAFLGSGSNGGVVEVKLTYKDIWDETDVLAENLLASGMKTGDMYVLHISERIFLPLNHALENFVSHLAF